MNFLEHLSQKSKHSSALIYALALLLVLTLFFLWLSFTGDYRLSSFLPSNTSYFYHWHEAKDVLSINEEKIANFFVQNFQIEARKELEFLGEGFLKDKQELIHFKLADQETNYYLLKGKNSLNKRQLKKLLADTNFSWRLLDKRTLVLSNDKTVALDFIKQENIFQQEQFFYESGETIFFQGSKPQFLNDILSKVGDESLFKADKLWWQLNLRSNWHTIDLSQASDELGLEQKKDFVTWDNLTIVAKPRLLIFGQDLNTREIDFLKENILSVVNNQAPHLKFGDNFWQKFASSSLYFLDQDGDWFLSKKNDWQSAVPELNTAYQVISKVKTLPDGSLYTEFLKNKEFTIEQLSWQDKNYWRFKDFYGVDLENNYYLSNSETLVKDILSNSVDFIGPLQNCVLNKEEKISNLIFLDKVASSQLKLEELLGEIDKFVLLFEYYNPQTQGLRLCWQ